MTLSRHRGASALLCVCILAALAHTADGATMRDKKAPKITHTPISKANAGEAIEIRATITDQSAVFGATVYYRLAGGGEFLSASLVKTTGDEYVATIPAAAVTGDVDYFLEAFDVHGNGPTLVGSQPKPLRIAVTAAAKPPDGGTGNNHSTTSRPDAGTVGPKSSPDSGTGTTKLPDTKPGPGQVKDGEGDSTGLVIAIVASVSAAVIVAAAVTGVLIYYFSQEPESPGTVTLKITAPPPVQSPLGSAP
jgi:hypothetical protein